VIWLEPWHSIADKPFRAANLKRELEREVASGHPLFGVPAEPIGYRSDCDDIAFRLLDGSDRIAVVHLTYSSNWPAASYPRTKIYDTMERWIGECMQPDHEVYADG
jgi:hypothetical protein